MWLPSPGPEHGTAFAKMTAHVHTHPPRLNELLPDAPIGLVKLVASMLANDPTSRPPTPRQIAEKLTPLAKGSDLSALIELGQSLLPN